MGLFSVKSKSAEPAQDPITPQAPDLETGNQPTTEHKETLSPVQTSTSAHQKWALSSQASDGDTALALFSNPDELHEEITPQDEARLQRKIDFMILPYLAVCYAFFYIDKTTLSYAAIFGIRNDLHLVGTQYNWLSSIFYFGFLAWACKLQFSHSPPMTKYSFMLMIIYSSHKLYDAAFSHWQVFGSKYLHVGILPHATSYSKELHPACRSSCIFRCSRSML